MTRAATHANGRSGHAHFSRDFARRSAQCTSFPKRRPSLLRKVRPNDFERAIYEDFYFVVGVGCTPLSGVAFRCLQSAKNVAGNGIRRFI